MKERLATALVLIVPVLASSGQENSQDKIAWVVCSRQLCPDSTRLNHAGKATFARYYCIGQPSRQSLSPRAQIRPPHPSFTRMASVLLWVGAG